MKQCIPRRSPRPDRPLRCRKEPTNRGSDGPHPSSLQSALPRTNPCPRNERILSELSADELRAGVDLYELEVDDRRMKADLADALAKSRKRDSMRFWSDSRATVSKRCAGRWTSMTRAEEVGHRRAAHGGIGNSEGVRSTEVDQEGQGEETPQRETTDMERGAHRTPGTLTFEQLKSHVWSAADILRGSIDSSDYKSFILGLLFVEAAFGLLRGGSGEAHRGRHARGGRMDRRR